MKTTISTTTTATSRQVERICNLLPEVTWDRWVGDLNDELGIGIFGWIPRPDGKSDFVFLRIDHKGAWMVATSSAEHSAGISKRLHFGNHSDCKRAEDYFDIKATHEKSHHAPPPA